MTKFIEKAHNYISKAAKPGPPTKKVAPKKVASPGGATPKWWRAMTTEQQKHYLRLHPSSKYKIVPHSPAHESNFSSKDWNKLNVEREALGQTLQKEALKKDVNEWAKKHNWKISMETPPTPPMFGEWKNKDKFKTLTSPNGNFKIALSKPGRFGMTGGVYFKHNGKWQSFDKHGVDSFEYSPSHHDEGTPIDLGHTLDNQISHVQQHISDLKQAKEFDLGPRKISWSPRQIKKFADTLREKGDVIVGVGLGRGFRFFTRNVQDSKPAPKEITKLVGKPVYWRAADIA